MIFDTESYNTKIDRQYRMFPFGGKAICPECSGLLSVAETQEEYECNDCKSTFKVVSEGITDKDVFCERIMN